jgi:hypothetical protein
VYDNTDAPERLHNLAPSLEKHGDLGARVAAGLRRQQEAGEIVHGSTVLPTIALF